MFNILYKVTRKNTAHFTKIRAHYINALILLVTSAFSPVSNSIPIIAWDLPFGTPSASQTSFNFGWEFSTSNSITVTNLGLWDGPRFKKDGIDGLYQMGLWTTDGTLLASTSITGLGDTPPYPLDSSSQFQWVFQSISPTLIGPGSYVASVYLYPNKPASFQQDQFLSYSTRNLQSGLTTFGSGITLDAVWSTPADAFQFPTDRTSISDVGAIFVAPNILFVPEPDTFALVTIGLLIFLLRNNKRRLRFHRSVFRK